MELRDQEIERLNNALKGGRPHDVISLEAQNLSNEKCIAHLNLQASTFRIHEYTNISTFCLETLKTRLEAGSVLAVQQIEYLQETNRTLEEKVKGLQQRKEDVSTEVANLSLKNRELCEELTHIDELAKRLEMDKDRVLETADTELQEAKVSVTTSERRRVLKQQMASVGLFSY